MCFKQLYIWPMYIMFSVSLIIHIIQVSRRMSLITKQYKMWCYTCTNLNGLVCINIMTKCKSQVVIENRSPRIYNSKQYTNNQKLKSCELNPFSVVVYFVQLKIIWICSQSDITLVNRVLKRSNCGLNSGSLILFSSLRIFPGFVRLLMKYEKYTLQSVQLMYISHSVILICNS